MRTPVSAALSDELRRRIFYVSPDIIDFRLIEESALIRTLEITTAAEHSTTHLTAKINEVVIEELLNQKAIVPKIIWRSKEARTTFHSDTFQTLLNRGLAFEPGPGQVTLAEPLIKLLDYLDARVRSIAKECFGAEEYQYPTLLPTRVLEDLDYFESFPQFVMFVTHLHNDIDVYREFRKEFARHPHITKDVFSRCQSHEFCLPPTMCYHTYHQFRGREMPQNKVVTSRGKSFRFEAKYHQGLERLWDFTIREIVFLGTREFVLKARADFMKRSQELIEELGLSAWCEVASDPFFAGQETVAKSFSQKMMELKYELRMNISADKSIAVASFNFHDNFFGQGFNITQAENAPIRTGCVGFGLERFAYALLCQLGLEGTRWPEELRQKVGPVL